MRRRLAAAVFATVAIAACAATEPSDDSSTVIVFGPYVGVEADRFAGVLDDFAESTGIDVVYTGSTDFVEDLRQRAGGARRPDVAIIPQPGVIDDLIERDAIVTLPESVRDTVELHHDDDTFDDTGWDRRYVVPYRRAIKSIVWYRPEPFLVEGWAVPTTMTELSKLVEEISARDDIDPWCFSIFSGTATGWPATDWVEDLVLRRAGPEIYDDWAAGRLSWQAPEIRSAFEEFETLVLDGERSFGGLRSVLQTDVSRASEPLFADPPGCALYKQASFAEDWLPAGVTVGAGQDVDTFVLPGTEPDMAPIVTSGDAAVQFEQRPNVDRLMDFLASPDGGEAWADAGGFVSALSSVDITSYFGDVDAGFARVLLDDRASRFDASDVLPADVGSGLLWRRITSWIEGTITLDELLTSIDAALGIESG